MMDNQKLQFLLVEDDDDHAALTERSLKRSETPCEVVRVADGAAALQYLRKEGSHSEAPTPDVVLLDLKLPRVNGLEVLEQMRADDALSMIPVVMLTTSDADCDRDRAYELHVNSYLVKPLQYSEFRELLSAVSNYWGHWNRPPALTQESA